MQRYKKKCNFARLKLAQNNCYNAVADSFMHIPHKEYSDAELQAKAERYCALEERCKSSVCKKLYEWGAARQQADIIIERLVADRFIDEHRYVRLYCHGKLRTRHWGRNKMAWELRGKDIGTELIAEGLSSLPDGEYYATLDKVAQAKYATLHDENEYDKRRKLTAFLLARGFTADEIRHWSAD